jgi:hypothetical protein
VVRLENRPVGLLQSVPRAAGGTWSLNELHSSRPHWRLVSFLEFCCRFRILLLTAMWAVIWCPATSGHYVSAMESRARQQNVDGNTDMAGFLEQVRLEYKSEIAWIRVASQKGEILAGSNSRFEVGHCLEQ